MNQVKKTGAWIAVLQIILLAMVLAIFLKFVNQQTTLIASQVVLLAAYFIVLFKKVKKQYLNDFTPYLVFFSVLALIVQLSWILTLDIKPGESFAQNTTAFFLIAIALVVFLAIFKLKFGRNNAVGKVLACNTEWAAVDIPFDIRSFVKAGKYVVKANKTYDKDSLVKIRLDKKWRKPKPMEIVASN